jgi:hypothetical protein
MPVEFGIRLVAKEIAKDPLLLRSESLAVKGHRLLEPKFSYPASSQTKKTK